ncbi:ABC transporter permease [Parafilimonas sp.]|uniref:ABC transporter permease n=1 Tax=Parafilimonas sp. TaxID=1969739 RepID=UPI0039E5417F
MFKNYFKTAWRNIIRTIGYSTLNVAGLAIGMAIALLIGLWVYDQYSFDKSLPGYERLYRVQRNFNSNGDTLTFLSTSLKLADALRNQVPEVEYVAESAGMGPHGLMAGNKKLYINGGIVGSDFLKMFQYPLIAGNAATVFKDAYSIVLNQSTAKALFGNDDPVNKTVRFDNEHDLKITGVMKDLPGNSSFGFNYLVPFSYLEQTNDNVKQNRTGSFGNNSYTIFVKLRPGADYAKVYPRIRDIEHTETDNRNAMLSYVTLQPMNRWHLYSRYVNGQDTEGFLEYVRMFTIIGLFVLLIACINFINLTTARSEKRAKEVGVRKAIGSQKRDLVIQFLLEAFLLTAIAFVFAILIAQLSLPAFNALTGNKILIPFTNTYFWLIMAGCLILTALLAGSRPAFYLSSFNPVKVLKGTVTAGKSSISRKILVVLQFSCSIALIISTIIIYQQIQYAKDRPSGYDLNRLLSTDMNVDISRNYTALKNELLQKGIADAVTTATSPATGVWWHRDVDNWPGKNANETIEMGTIYTTQDYFKTTGMTFNAGKDFINDNDTTSIIFNEAAIKKMRIKNPVSQVITWGGTQMKIVGVVKNALMTSPFTAAEPTAFLCYPQPQDIMMYRLSSKIKTHDAVTQLTAIFNKYNPAFPYTYTFADEDYAAKFNLETLVGKLAGVFAALAIFISCLGLFGLAAYIAEQRTKEIGIRKVLGASVQQVWLLLSKDFMVLVLISCLIAAPVSFFFLHNWLQHYDYRISIGAGVFVFGGLIALLITVITVSFQAIKAAMANPVAALRSE